MTDLNLLMAVEKANQDKDFGEKSSSLIPQVRLRLRPRLGLGLRLIGRG